MERSLEFKKLKKKKSNVQKLLQCRVEDSFEQRKKKRCELVEQRRCIVPGDSVDALVEDIEMLDVNKSFEGFELDDNWMKLLFSDVYLDQKNAVNKISNLMKRKWSAIQDVIDAGILPRLFKLLSEDHSSSEPNAFRSPLKLRITEILADVTTAQVKDLLPYNFIPTLVSVLDSFVSSAIKSNIILVLSNIAIESFDYRDMVLQHGAMSLVKCISESTTNVELLRNGSWCLSNLFCGSKPPPNFYECSQYVPVLVKLLNHEDLEIIGNMCWALSFLCHGDQKHIKGIIEAGACPRLIQLIATQGSWKILVAALEAITKIALGTDHEIQVILDCGALPVLKRLLSSRDHTIVNLTCLIISNIAVGRAIQEVIDAGIISDLLTLIKHGSFAVKVEAGWAIRQCMSKKRSSPAQIEYMVSIGCIETLCHVLVTNTDPAVLAIILRSLDVVMSFDQEYFEEFKRLCSNDFFATMMLHEEPQIRKYAQRIFKHFKLEF